MPPLEGLWYADDAAVFTSARDKSRWQWTLLLMIPGWVPLDLVDVSIARARQRREVPVALDRVRVVRLEEGHCLQTLHIGPFDDEAGVLADLHDRVMPDHGLAPCAPHHEVYLSDLRRVAPERRRTLLRQPVRRTDPTSRWPDLGVLAPAGRPATAR